MAANCHLGSQCDPVDQEHDYAGMVLYAYDSTSDWRLNGVHCKGGYTYTRSGGWTSLLASAALSVRCV